MSLTRLLVSSVVPLMWSDVSRTWDMSSPIPRERALLSSMPAKRAALCSARRSLLSRRPRMFSASAELALMRSLSFLASRSRISSSRTLSSLWPG